MISMYKAKLVLSSFLISFSLFGQSGKLQDEKELEVINFNSIKKVLQQDGLSEAAIKKEKQVKILKKEQVKIDNQRYHYPAESEFLGFLSEYWLVKNAQILNWDFEKPDYGIEKNFSNLMMNLGFYQKKFKILLINTPAIVRAGLPGSNESILLLSVPFIRSLDLSKVEISLLLFEDFLRLEQGYFKKNISTKKLESMSGTNFKGQKVDTSIITEILKNYDNQIMDRGYTFQQQFEVTKKMDAFLKSNPELWNTYFKLLGKLDRFLKSNSQYKNYIKLYPSPEMQIKWISPEEKVL